MRVLITGGGGFIGAWLSKRLLASGHEVQIFDLRKERNIAAAIVGSALDRIDWVLGDVSDGNAVRQAAEGCDLLVHLAAVLTPACQQDPVRGAQINLIGTLNVFEAARVHGLQKVLYMSSAGVYGTDDGSVPYPLTHYGAFKLAGEGSARAYHLDHGISSLGVRPLVVYGAGRETGLTAGPTIACRAAARGETYIIPFSGDSNFVYVDDVAAAFAKGADTTINGAHVHNILGEKSSAESIAGEIKRLIPRADISVNGPKLPVVADIDDSEIEKTLPGLKRTPLSEGLAATIEHYRPR